MAAMPGSAWSLLDALHRVHNARPRAAERFEVVILSTQRELSEFTDYVGCAQQGGPFVFAADDKAREAEWKKQVTAART